VTLPDAYRLGHVKISTQATGSTKLGQSHKHYHHARYYHHNTENQQTNCHLPAHMSNLSSGITCYHTERLGRRSPVRLSTDGLRLGAQSYGAIGRVNEKHDPFPSLLSTVIRPPWASINRLAIVRPRPLPPVTLARDLSTL
jgi:hypothetical protein